MGETMKISLAAVAVLWMGAAVAQAPDPADGGPHPGFRHESAAQRIDHLATLLDLTDAQKTQVQAILDEQHAKMKAQHDAVQASGQKPTFEQMKAEHDQLRQETLTKLTPVLTPAQLKKFQVLMEERGPPGGPH
jgi:Spy/CpxP family protein refolding chaperone